MLRPEVAAQYAQRRRRLIARGFAADIASALATKTFAGRAALQGTVIGFDKTFILQTIAFPRRDARCSCSCASSAPTREGARRNVRGVIESSGKTTATRAARALPDPRHRRRRRRRRVGSAPLVDARARSRPTTRRSTPTSCRSPRASAAWSRHVKRHDHQQVKAGDVLFEIDPADLDVEVARAEAELEAAQAQQAAADAQVAIVAVVVDRRSVVREGAADRRRRVACAAPTTGARRRGRGRAREGGPRERRERARSRAAAVRQGSRSPKRELEHAQQARDVAQAALDAANAQLDARARAARLAQSRVAEAQGASRRARPVDAQVAAGAGRARSSPPRGSQAAKVALDKAKLDALRTRRSPRRSTASSPSSPRTPVRPSAPGQTLLMLVPNETYVVANFKEVADRPA